MSALEKVLPLMLLLLIVPVMPIFAQFPPQEQFRTIIVPVAADSFVDPDFPSLNYGGSPELKVGISRAGVPKTAYLRFSVSAFELSGFLGATLNVYLKSKTESVTSVIAAIQVSPGWDELRINSLNAPMIGLNSSGSINDIVAFVNRWHSWDVSSFVGNISDTGAEVSFAMRLLNGPGENVFSSKDSKFVPFIEIRTLGDVNDPEPPVFGNIRLEPNQPTVEDIIEIFAEISDEGSGVEKVTLNYIKSSETNWVLTDMEVILGGLYYSALARQPSNTTFFFFIEAQDFAGNSISSAVISFNVTRPAYYREIQVELNQTKQFYESQLANQTLDFDKRLNSTILSFQNELGLLQNEMDLLAGDIEELLFDYEILLLDHTRLGSDSRNLESSYAQVLALYNELKGQYSEIELAYQGQRNIGDGLRASLDEIRKNYSELSLEYENSLARLDITDQRAGQNYLLAIGASAGFGLLALAAFSLWYFGRRSAHPTG
ncbi:MAG: DNRLRE domain-containing protein [Nitrososphaerales archaeon]